MKYFCNKDDIVPDTYDNYAFFFISNRGCQSVTNDCNKGPAAWWNSVLHTYAFQSPWCVCVCVWGEGGGGNVTNKFNRAERRWIDTETEKQIRVSHPDRLYPEIHSFTDTHIWPVLTIKNLRTVFISVVANSRTSVAQGLILCGSVSLFCLEFNQLENIPQARHTAVLLVAFVTLRFLCSLFVTLCFVCFYVCNFVFLVFLCL